MEILLKYFHFRDNYEPGQYTWNSTGKEVSKTEKMIGMCEGFMALAYIHSKRSCFQITVQAEWEGPGE